MKNGENKDNLEMSEAITHFIADNEVKEIKELIFSFISVNCGFRLDFKQAIM